MPASDLVIKGAREHNLRSVDVTVHRNQLVCLTGVSGSGKSSLAFDTVFAEGQRRYVASLSSFARQFLGQMPKPDVDSIEGLSPTISISQKTSGRNPRSTVGTITEIYDYLRVLYARVGQGHCPQCNRPITAQTREQIIAQILSLEEGDPIVIFAPVIRGQKGEYRDLFVDLIKQGFARARVDGQVVSLRQDLSLDRQMRHNIEVVIDRLKVNQKGRTRIGEAVELALRMGNGNLIIAPDKDKGVSEESTTEQARSKGQRGRGSRSDINLSSQFACTHCKISFEPLSPQLFSFNSPQGMCLECDGLGEYYSFDPELLVPRTDRSFQQGCFEILGKLKAMGRWQRHIYKGVAETVERMHNLPAGTMLETAWEELGDDLQNIWLWGTGEQHITYTWRGGERGMKYGGTFEGIVPELLSKYRKSRSTPQIRRLEKYMRVICCPDCEGQRLNEQARAVRITTTEKAFSEHAAKTLPEVCAMPISEAVVFFQSLDFSETQQLIAESVLKEICGRLGFLENVGLDYLSLDRTAPTLSGGESQRIRLAGQIGCGLVGVLYILDEPSIGLHPRDNHRLLETLTQLRDLGNTVVVVEHDEDTMRTADHIIDFGPGPGVRGGKVVATGDWSAIAQEKNSITGQYLTGTARIEVPQKRRPTNDRWLKILGARHNNLKKIDVEIPLGTFVCVTGVSGSGKSSLVNDILVEALRRDLNGGNGNPGAHDAIEGLEQLDKLIAIDQSPIGRTPRSNPATYIKVFDEIRRLYALLPDSKRRGYQPGRFSFNVKTGRCEACEGCGANKLEMDFLAAIWVTCPVCSGKRFNRETLQVLYKGKSIADVLEMDIQEALSHFENIPKIHDKLKTLHDVGLDYLKLGQPSPTLSGGEAQRIKLARELVKRSTGKTLYLLDEPTTGLHFADIKMLLEVLTNFVEAGNTVLVVEHNLDVIKTADWVIDLGPEGGQAGGQLIGVGTPEHLASQPDSYTAASLLEVLSGKRTAPPRKQKSRSSRSGAARPIRVGGARQHNLKGVDVDIPRDAMTVCCGVSGSGKSSLAMDTIYAEGQRRYVESLSSYARQFVSQMQKPQLEKIEGLSPAIAIEQRHMGHTPRSTVGTVTELYDYLRILMARLGTPYCPVCDVPIGTQSVDEIIERIFERPTGTRLYLLAPLTIAVGEQYETLWDQVRSQGYIRVRVDGQTYSIDAAPTIDRRRRYAVEVVIDRVKIQKSSRGRIAEGVEAALSLGEGTMQVAIVDDAKEEPNWETKIHSQHLACGQCGLSFESLSPHNFSFNSPLGWCESCEGLGTETGANLTALLRNGKLTLKQGAVALWPSVQHRVFRWMLESLSRQTGIAIDVPFENLSAKDRRFVLHGTGEKWFDVKPTGKQGKQMRPLFRFQYKGLYPALDEASRLSARFRSRMEHLLDEVECSQCGGSRLREDAAASKFRGKTIHEYGRMPLGQFLRQVRQWKLDRREKKIAGELIREIKNRTTFLCDVGLDYLSIARGAPTLSGGESQRIRLASQVGSGLCGVLYVLDEPTIGLHPRDNTRLLGALRKLRDLGNTLLLVEHDREVIASADNVLDFGPRAGRHGGEIVARGNPEQLMRRRNSVTGPFLSGKQAISIPTHRRCSMAEEADDGGEQKKARGKSSGKKIDALAIPPEPYLEVTGARHNNLQNINVQIPLGIFTVVTGVSGSGKSSLVNDILYNSLARTLHRAGRVPAAHSSILGIEHINKVIRVDQRPLGNSPASNPATYTGLFDLIRKLYAQLPESRVRGYTPRRFSFNAPGGRCDDCDGNGKLVVEMHFLPDVWVECDTCHGKRYNPETLAVRYHGHSIADVLEMPCEKALLLFDKIPKIRRILQTLCDVGLGYLQLGQSAATLSGGEAQRVKLAAELARPDTGQTLYLLDEPTTGLHFEDLRKLLHVLNRLVDLGNSVVVIEHNLDVIKCADWVIDMGPEAGDEGGHVVACGTPEQVVNYATQATKVNAKRLPRSFTGEVLQSVLQAGPYEKRKVYDFAEELRKRQGDLKISEIGSDQKMPWEIDGQLWHTQNRVGRKGETCQWDGKILEKIVNTIEQHGGFSDTNWNSRSVVEIAAAKKSDGWFFHALTNEQWLIKLKFRTAIKTFNREKLVEKIGMAPLNDMHELPVYGTDRRVKCRSLRGPWQEIELRVHSLNEIDHPGFWAMLDDAVAGFRKMTEKKQCNPEDVMPWKVLGKKWHFCRKGFPIGKRPAWPLEVLEELHDLLATAAPEGQLLWNNQQVVHLFVGVQKEPWATLHTKRVAGVELTLTGPTGQFTLGRIAGLGSDRKLVSGSLDVIKLQFQTPENVHHIELEAFLKEHLAGVQNATAVV